MSELIKCVCPQCGQKYRLPVEYQGRHARCKKCGDKFEVPKGEKKLEDSVLDWLNDSDAEAPESTLDQPRVITMKRDAAESADGSSRRSRGPIRLKNNGQNGEPH